MKTPPAALTQPYLDALRVGDRMRALQAIVDTALSHGASIPDMYLHVIQPAQVELGRLWQEDEINVTEEHVGTRIADFVMSCLSHYLPRGPRNGKTILIGCVEGELHEMGPRMCTDLLDAAGFDVRFFGADVPTSILLRMLERKTPDLLALSVTMDGNLSGLTAIVAAVRARFGARPRIAVGGQAVNAAPSLAEQLGVLTPGEDARAATRALIDLLAVPPG